MRVGAVSFPLTEPNNYQAWLNEVDKWLKLAVQKNVELLVFPEYFTLALENHSQFKSWFNTDLKKLFTTFSQKNKILVLAGSHNIGTNTALFFDKDGKCIEQSKINLIPSETEEAPLITPGDQISIIPFAHGKLATTICYDVEFPEITRAVVKEGVNLLLCPSWTEGKDGFHRVRFCAHARAIENQLYLIHAPLIGSFAPWGLPDKACGSAAILAPSDAQFPADGILVEGKWSEADLVVADLDFDKLQSVRMKGSVRTYRDFIKQTTFQVKTF